MTESKERQSGNAADSVSFEKALAELEDIVAKMEQPGTDLDTMVKSFEKGLSLIKRCSDKLASVERKVEKLSRNADGTVAAAPFDETLN